MVRPYVSVIIPCYNAEAYIAEAIESALGQTYSPLEVIVVDDGSTDGSREVIRSFGDTIRWESGSNCGGSAARNRGVQMARGDVIQFLDADDLLDPEKIKRQIALLTDPRELVFCDARVVDHTTGRPLGVWGGSYVSASSDAVIYLLNCVVQTAAPLHWKPNLLAVGGWREDLPAGQDPDLHMRLALAGIRFTHVPKALYTVRRVAESVSKRHAERVYSYWRRSALEASEELRRRGNFTEERAEAFAGYFANIARRYLRAGLRLEADDCFAQARVFHPDGGIPQAYRGGTRQLSRLVGPVMTERLVGLKRWAFPGTRSV